MTHNATDRGDAWIDDLLQIAVCPADHIGLKRAPNALVARLNDLVQQRALRDATGSLVKAPLDAALLRNDHDRIYPIRGRIPELLPESAILLDDDDRATLS